MTSIRKVKTARRRRIPVVLKGLVLCLIALLALLLLLPEPPARDDGGATSVTKHVPALRDTINPLAKERSSEQPSPQPVLNRNVARQVQPSETPAPEPDIAPPPQLLASPSLPPAPVRKPAEAGPPEPEPSPGRQAERKVASLPPHTAPGGRVALPSKSDINDWLKSQAWEFLGGVDPQGNILYRFEVWLEAPPGVLGAIKRVSYDYAAPSATPKIRQSDNAQGGFRVRFGGLACAQKVTVEVTMVDGRSRRAVVDGCQALN